MYLLILSFFNFRPENLKKGALPVYDDDIIDLVQVNMFGRIGYGE